MGVRLVRILNTPCTLELAKDIYSLPRVEKDRKLEPRRVDKLIKDVKKGPLRPFNWATAVDLSTGVKYRVNGQHSSYLILAKKIPVEGVCTLEEYECDDYKGVAALWSTFDSEVSVRKRKEVHLASCGASKKLDKALNPTFLHTVNSAIYYFITSYNDQIELSTSDRAELTDKYAHFVNWSSEVFNKRAFARAPILTCAVYTWVLEDLNAGGNGFTFSSPQPTVEDFWGKLISGDNLDNHKPIRLLREFILSHKITGNGARIAWMRDGKNKIATPWVFTNFCVSAWNAYRTGTTFSELHKPKTRDLRYWFSIVLNRANETYAKVNQVAIKKIREEIEELGLF